VANHAGINSRFRRRGRIAAHRNVIARAEKVDVEAADGVVQEESVVKIESP